MAKSKKQISFLITHYNRPDDLAKCLAAIRNLNILDSEIVVCDDASEKRHLEKIKGFQMDHLIVAEVNRGLAANINKGIAVCQGKYIVYCQEDFILNPKIIEILPQCSDLLESKKVDMIRFTSNLVFNKLIPLTTTISLIPKFSFQNFFQNYYQYSDHPFITTRSFYDKYGTYLEDTSGRYGETEYAIRILKSNAKIGITNNKFASTIDGSFSVLINESIGANKEFKASKKLIKIARAFRLYLELILYNKSQRGLLTYKNFRK